MVQRLLGHRRTPFPLTTRRKLVHNDQTLAREKQGVLPGFPFSSMSQVKAPIAAKGQGNRHAGFGLGFPDSDQVGRWRRRGRLPCGRRRGAAGGHLGAGWEKPESSLSLDRS